MTFQRSMEKVGTPAARGSYALRLFLWYYRSGRQYRSQTITGKFVIQTKCWFRGIVVSYHFLRILRFRNGALDEESHIELSRPDKASLKA